MCALVRPSERSPAPSPAIVDAFVAGGIGSPPLPYAVGSPGPAPEPSEVVVAAGGRRGGGGASLSPPLIAMLAVVGAALMVVLYARLVRRVFRAARRRWRRRRRLRLLMFPGGSGSPASVDSFASFTTYDNYYHTYSPYHNHGYGLHGLDDAAIKSLPTAQFAAAAAARECAVCLLEFADGDELRALPLCAHAFHADCIDVWLRARASCPLCRASAVSVVVEPRLPPPVASSPVARVRPSLLDDLLIFHPLDPQSENNGAEAVVAPEIAPASPDHELDPRDFLLLKRSYSLGFERSLAVEAASTASPPWRYRASAAASASSRGRTSFWSKRWPSPFGGGGGGGASSRGFSFRSYRSAAAAKSSPFSRRRGSGATGSSSSGFFVFTSILASEPPSILASARRTRAAAAASSRLRCGDPEALLSPDRLSSR